MKEKKKPYLCIIAMASRKTNDEKAYITGAAMRGKHRSKFARVE